LSLATAVALPGLVAGRKEGWSRFDSVYWSFITATTVGYGDIRPVKRASKISAVVIALLGPLKDSRRTEFRQTRLSKCLSKLV